MDWMNFAIFTMISSLEYVAVLAFIAALFRFRYFLKMKTHIFMVCVLLSYVSYTTRTVYGLAIESTLIQVGLLTLFIWLLFRVQVYYSLLMALTGHVAYGVVQFLLIFLFTFSGIFTLNDLESIKWPSHILPIATSIVFFLISIFVIKKNWGFSFVPDRTDEIYGNYKRNTLILLVITASFVLLSTLHRIGITLISNLYVSTLIYVIAFLVLIILSIRKERSND